MFKVGRMKSEREFPADLNVARRGNGAVPYAERRAGDVGISEAPSVGRREDVPVPKVERLNAQQESHLFAKLRVLFEPEVLVVVAESTVVSHARTASKVKVEIRRGLKCGLVEDGLAHIEAALLLRPDIRSVQHAGDAARRKLTWQVAVAGAE